MNDNAFKKNDKFIAYLKENQVLPHISTYKHAYIVSLKRAAYNIKFFSENYLFLN